MWSVGWKCFWLKGIALSVHGVHGRQASRRDERMAMAINNARARWKAFQRILERTELELVRALKNRDSISVDRCADPMDELQLASERDVAIRNLGSESFLLRQVRAAQQRIRDGSFGICMDCEHRISPKRLEAVPWALRCIRCQEAADGNGEKRADFSSQALIEAAYVRTFGPFDGSQLPD
jgi:DnaK suppressor protein